MLLGVVSSLASGCGEQLRERMGEANNLLDSSPAESSVADAGATERQPGPDARTDVRTEREAGSTDPCQGVACSGHGKCVISSGQAACTCDQGYQPQGLACVADNQLVIYPSPGDLSTVEHLKKSSDYAVTVDGLPVFVYETDNYWVHSNGVRPEDKAAFAIFSFGTGTVTVRVTCSFPVASVAIRPSSYGVTFTQSGNTITFQLSQPRKLSVEINDRKRPLFIFADRPEAPDTTAQHYFGPGVHHLGAKYPVAAGERVYLAGGAVVEGTLMLGGDNIQIRGRGILTAGQWSWADWLADKKLSLITQTKWSQKGHTYSGVTLLNSPGWFVNGAGANKKIDNLRVIAWAGNSDAPHLDEGGLMQDTFIFNNDDQLMVNSGSNAVFRNCVVWKGSWGRSIISLKSSLQMEGHLWEEIDVIGSSNPASPIFKLESFQVSGGHMKGYTVRNVRIEGPRVSPLIHVDAAGFDLLNLTFENVSAPTQLANEGHLNISAGNKMDGLHFKGLKLGGGVMTSLAGTHLTTQGTVTNVTFSAGP